MPPSRARFGLGVALLGLPVSEVASRRLRAAHPHPLELRMEPAMPRMLGFHEWSGASTPCPSSTATPIRVMSPGR
jgi:hypothetical protein